MRAFVLMGMLLVGLMPVAEAAGVPTCAGEAEITAARIMRVEINGVLVMTDGRALKLEGIRLPNAPQALADQAKAAAAGLAKGSLLDVHATYPKQDRYDRVRGQIFTEDGLWLQMELLRRGLARVDLSPDRGECWREFYAAEAEARQARAGLWGNPAYAIRTPESVKADIGSYQIVAGRVLNTSESEGAIYLEFGQDWRRDFMVVIAAEDVKTFKWMGVDPRNYDGKMIRVRGLVQARGGPAIQVGNPKQIELLQ